MHYFKTEELPFVRFLSERVDRGVEYLNENEPGWYNRINLSMLDVAWPEDCVLGQLDDDFDYYLENHGLSHKQVQDMGFDAPNLPTVFLCDGLMKTYAFLTHLWKNRIEALRSL